ncbi:MAG: ATP-binding protein [Bacteroidales bacterium]
MIRLIESSRAIVAKWNARYIKLISACVQEQMLVLESVINNIVFFIDEHSSEDIESNGISYHSNVYELHKKNRSSLNTVFNKLKTKSETKDLVADIVSDLLFDIQCLDACVIDIHENKSDFSKKDTWKSKFLKNIGDVFYKFGNVYRKCKKSIVKSDEKENVRQHTIYYQGIMKGFLLGEYMCFLQEITFKIQQEIISYAISVFEQEEKFLSSCCLSEVEVSKIEKPNLTELFNEVETFFLKNEDSLIERFKKSGTIEYPVYSISLKAKRSLTQANKHIDTALRLWDRTFYTFYEDWRFREEILGFISGVKLIEYRTLDSYKSKLNNTLLPFIEQKKISLEQLDARVPIAENADLDTLKHFFTTELYQLKKDAREQDFKEILDKTRSEIIKLLQKIELDVRSGIETLPEKSGVVSSPDYKNGIKKSEIYFFSPAEFIEFDSVPPFFGKINKINHDFMSSFDEIVAEFSDFDHITDFTIDTAVSMINAQNNPEQTILMFREGIKRSLNILFCIAELVDDIINKKEKELAESFIIFIDNVKKLDDNDRILSIYSSLLKSKAIQQSKDKKDKVVNLLLSSASGVILFIKAKKEFVNSYYKDIRKKLNLDKGPVTVSSEISNYLSEINKRIYGLPVIYRYLFENAPVKEVNLFLSREKEVRMLDKAFKDWKSGNFAATLLVGENGSGKSSLLQYYLTTVKGGIKVLYMHIDRFYWQEHDFYELMQNIFENDSLKSDNDVIEQINASQGQQVIVLDGLERAFLRRPGGFNCLHKLLSLIVSTNKHVFWICSVSLHTCTYLEKTISIKENFDYIVTLNSLSSSEIESIIMKRHRLSGYLAKYEDNIKQDDDKKKKRDRQSVLKSQFFSDLNKFADSNISLSMYFWLESILAFTDNELSIRKFLAPDFRFLETLSSEKIFALLIIILHGRIDIESHAQICNQDKKYSRKILTVLKEDSILVLRGSNYMLNGVLYRHVIQLLKNKNMIH